MLLTKIQLFLIEFNQIVSHFENRMLLTYLAVTSSTSEETTGLTEGILGNTYGN